jgi:hypothetical protein
MWTTLWEWLPEFLRAATAAIGFGEAVRRITVNRRSRRDEPDSRRD